MASKNRKGYYATIAEFSQHESLIGFRYSPSKLLAECTVIQVIAWVFGYTPHEVAESIIRRWNDAA